MRDPGRLVDQRDGRTAVCGERLEERSVHFALGRRRGVEQRHERRVRAARRLDLVSIRYRRSDGHRRAAAEHAPHDRLEAGDRRSVRRMAVGNDPHPGRAPVESAQQAPEIRLFERQHHVCRAMALDEVCTEREQQARQDHDHRHRRRHQVDPLRGVRGSWRAYRRDRRRVGHRDAKQQCAGGVRGCEDGVHHRRVEERALPGCAIFECQTADVQPGDHAGGKGRSGDVEHAYGARALQRRRADAPVGDQRNQRLLHGTACESTRRWRSTTCNGRQHPAHRPWRAAVAVMQDITDRNERVNREIPGEQPKYRWRKDVDALCAVDLVEKDTEHEADAGKRCADPGTPTQCTHRPRQQRLARAKPLDHECRAARQERR